jgi:hypothetical protein
MSRSPTNEGQSRRRAPEAGASPFARLCKIDDDVLTPSSGLSRREKGPERTFVGDFPGPSVPVRGGRMEGNATKLVTSTDW